MIHKIPKGLSTEKIVASYSSISADTTSLDFSHIALYKYRRDLSGLSRVFNSIPDFILELNLSSTGLTNGRAYKEALPPSKVAHILASISKSVRSVDLSFNTLGGQTKNNLTLMLRALPPITSLNLSGNDLGCRGYVSTVTPLSPSDSLVFNLATPLAALPNTLKRLDLGENNLGYRTSAQLVSGLGGIGDNVETLDLACNELEQLGDGLALVLAASPRGVKTLGLSENNLNRLPTAILATALASLPSYIEVLDLRWNDLSHFTGPELALIFAAIPRTIRVLDLRGNNLNAIPTEELAAAFAKLPAGMSVLFDESNPAERDLIDMALRSVPPLPERLTVAVLPPRPPLVLMSRIGLDIDSRTSASEKTHPTLRTTRHDRPHTALTILEAKAAQPAPPSSATTLTTYRKPGARPAANHVFDLHCVGSFIGGSTFLLIGFYLWLSSRTSADRHAPSYSPSFFATVVFGAALTMNGLRRALHEEPPKPMIHKA